MVSLRFSFLLNVLFYSIETAASISNTLNVFENILENAVFEKTIDHTYLCIPRELCLEQDSQASTRSTQGGAVLMGGSTKVDAAFNWQIDRANGGDFVILRESKLNLTDISGGVSSGVLEYMTYVWNLGLQNSHGIRTLSTIVIHNRDAGSNQFVLSCVSGAEAIFFAGGDQSKYTGRIAGTPLQALLWGKAVDTTIGGTSAGNAIQGLWIYTGEFGTAESNESLLNPYNEHVNGSIVGPLLQVEPLMTASVIMDDHFVARDRMGRMVVFMARIAADGFAGPSPQVIRSIGVDEVTALLLDHSGNITAVGNGTTYMCELQSVALSNITCQVDAPLSVSNVQCERLQAAGFVHYDDPSADTFNTQSWAGSGVQYSFNVVNGVITGEPYGP